MSDSKIVLIAEDNPDEVFLMSRVFARTGLPFELRFVTNGQQAIDYLEGKPPFDKAGESPRPSAIILDLKMPGVDGFEVLTWLRLRPELSRIPAVVHSSSGIREDRERARELGALDYYVKGSGPSELMAMFRAVSDRWLKGSVSAPVPAKSRAPGNNNPAPPTDG